MKGWDNNMKVFISWSGEKSKKIALIFRDWLPTVIQSIEPFVSSEDIDKGTRWNTDIAQELKETNFGLICVTKDNINSAWLNFEAGALSKTINNTYVAPLLFDVKPSDLKGSPLSQFQATSLSADDMKRLIETLNSATGNSLVQTRLDKAFELCYPDLEKNIKELKESAIQEVSEDEDASKTFDANILEELLETARNTQRILGNTDTKLYTNIEEVQKKIDNISEQYAKQRENDVRRTSKKFRYMFAEDLLFRILDNDDSNDIFPHNVFMLLSLFKEDCPWIYDGGCEVVKAINSKASKTSKIASVEKFKSMLEYSFRHPVMREISYSRGEFMHLINELPALLLREIDKQN